MSVESTATPSATFNEICPPWSTRESESRLSSSVPNQWAADGPDVGSSRFCWSGSARTARRTKQASDHEHEEPEARPSPARGDGTGAPRSATAPPSVRGADRLRDSESRVERLGARARPTRRPRACSCRAARRASPVRGRSPGCAGRARAYSDVGERGCTARRTPWPPPSTPGSPGSRTVRARRRTAARARAS